MPPSYYQATDWGLVESHVVTRLTTLLGTDVRSVKSAPSEARADEDPKPLPSVYLVSYGTTAVDSDSSGNGYLRQDEDWQLAVLIYGASGLAGDTNYRAIQTLASKVKGIVNGYTPADQVNDDQCLRLRVDAPVEEWEAEASAGLKVRQTYVLPCLLQALVT